MCLILGEVGVGKTLLLKRLQKLQDDTKCSFKEVPPTIPTVGTNLTTLNADKKNEVTLRELGGAMAPIWQTYYDDCNSIIFMVDVSNPSQVSASTLLLLTMLSSDQLQNVAVMILLNKTDLSSSIHSKELKYLMNIDHLLETAMQRVTVMECSVKNGVGLKEVLVWVRENCSDGGDKT